jgi:type I restriction enzyme S subunit
MSKRIRLRFVAPLRPKTPPGSLTGDIAFLPMEAIGDDGAYDHESVRPAAEVADSGYTYFEQGDVVRARVTPCFENGKGALLSTLTGGRGLGTTELFVFKPSQEIDARFLYYVTVSQEFTEQGTATLYGAHGVRRVDDQFARDYRIWVPPVTIQRAIADYLDRETARIDALIAAKRRMVELLEERRISAAHATVTGAQVSGSREPSGVPWLGSVPSHWRMARLGSLFHVQLGRMLSAERSVGPHLRRYLRNINIRWGSVDTSDLAEMNFPLADRTRYLVCTGDLLVNEGGAGIGRAAIWDGEIDEIYYQKSVHRVRPRGSLSVRWLLEWFRVAVDRKVFQVEGNLATIPHVPAEALRQYRVPCPPVAEAEALIVALDATIERDMSVRRATETQLALLQERRQALITAAVTGQLDIPGAA